MLVKKIDEVRKLVKEWKAQGLSIGYVPTMGALHEGHESLINRAVKENDKVIVSVFVNPAYFGQKDAQQVAVLKRMVRDLSFDVEIVPCPIIREEDGLAKSSRNTYLSVEERKAALVLSRSLKLAKDALDNGERNADKLKEIMTNEINKEPLAKIDYVEVVDGEDLTSISGTIEHNILVPMAVYIGKTRLIDNFSYDI